MIERQIDNYDLRGLTQYRSCTLTFEFENFIVRIKIKIRVQRKPRKIP